MLYDLIKRNNGFIRNKQNYCCNILIALLVIGIGKISDIAFHVDKPEKSVAYRYSGRSPKFSIQQKKIEEKS